MITHPAVYEALAADRRAQLERQARARRSARIVRQYRAEVRAAGSPVCVGFPVRESGARTGTSRTDLDAA